MILSVSWERATRPPEERTKFEAIYKNRILDFFNGVENAQKAYDFYRYNPRIPFQDWPRAHYYAFRTTSRAFTPWEKVNTNFKLTFE